MLVLNKKVCSSSQQIVPPEQVAVTPPAPSPTKEPDDDHNTLPALIPDYDSDDEDDDYNPTINHRARRSKQVLRQQSAPTHTGPNHIAALAASETASVPDLTVQQRKLTHDLGRANLDLQMKELAFEENFTGVVIDENTGETLEYRHLIILSAWAIMEGEFQFDAIPIAPPGSRILMHDKPGKRKTFGMNARPAWYLGPCFKHYRTFRGIVPSTGGERLSDTVRFQHHAIAIPDLTPANSILEATRQLNDAIC